MSLKDRNGDPFTGTPAELKRHNNKLCKRASRAKADPVLELPLPPGIKAALDRVCAAGGFEDPRELLDLQIRRLDALLAAGDRQLFDALTRVTVTIPTGSLNHYFALLGDEPDADDELIAQPPAPAPLPR